MSILAGNEQKPNYLRWIVEEKKVKNRALWNTWRGPRLCGNSSGIFDGDVTILSLKLNRLLQLKLHGEAVLSTFTSD